MESESNPYVWAYTLDQEQKKYNRSAVEMAEFYAKYHRWSEKFLNEVMTEITALLLKA